MSALTDQRASVLAHAQAITDRAVKAGRVFLSDSEQVEVDADLAQIKELDRRIASGQLVKNVMALGGASEPDPDAPGGPFGEDAKAGITHALKARTTYRATVDAKALLSTNAMLPPSGTGVVSGLYPGGAFPLSSLFANQQADGPVVRYYRMTAGTAAVVAEGAAKPDAGVAVTPVDLALEKLACLAQVTDEADADAPFIVNQVAAELQAAVATAENGRILATFGSTSGVLTGAGTNATVVDAIADAISGQESFSGKTPSAVIAHPNVVAAVRKSKASGSGTYTLDPTAAGPTSIFGVPVYSTPATAAATVWVVEATGVVIYRRGALTVDVGTNADDFAHNVRTLRAEERVGTAVMRPSCLTKITLS